VVNRESILKKIRALLAKTTANGCTEPEMLAAIDMARAMMDAYEVTEAPTASASASMPWSMRHTVRRRRTAGRWWWSRPS
jgi:Protein of unknown function (DUF2786)